MKMCGDMGVVNFLFTRLHDDHGYRISFQKHARIAERCDLPKLCGIMEIVKGPDQSKGAQILSGYEDRLGKLIGERKIRV
jgi:hypothetical protein